MNPTILLVEDDANDVFFMRRALQLAEDPNPLQVASDGQRAIDYLQGAHGYADRTRFPLPCLVLLDLKLPQVMGMDVLRWIREQPHLGTIVVLVFTSSRLPPDISKAYRLGANSYLVKPSTPGELPDMARLIKQYWLEMNQSVPVEEDVEGPVGGPPPSIVANIFTRVG